MRGKVVKASAGHLLSMTLILDSCPLIGQRIVHRRHEHGTCARMYARLFNVHALVAHMCTQVLPVL